MAIPEFSMFGDAEREFEITIERFEKAIASGEEVRIEDFLPEAAESRHRYLVELVHVDLELRLKSGRPRQVKDYLTTFPELTEREIRDLLVAEFRLRRERDPALTAKAFLADYPQHVAALAEKLSSLTLDHATPTDRQDTERPDQDSFTGQRELNNTVSHFKKTWGRKDQPSIEELLPSGAPLRTAVLVELVRVDLEARLQAGQPARVEEYLRRFPELQQNESIVQDLIQTEFNFRSQSEPGLLPNEYRRRFPDLPRPKLPERKLQTRCPHCHSPIELIDESSLREILCPSCGSTFNLISAEDTATHGLRSNRIAHFDLLVRLGVGTFGTVWKARDTKLDRIVAVKLPRKDQLGQSEAEQFFREARAAAQLKHPHIVSVHEVGREGETFYLVSDYVAGATLREWLSGQRLNNTEAAELCLTLADALRHAHQAGVIHRDLKPSNIMMDLEGQPHLMDFGLAKREAGEITMTVEGAELGTPAYMSPEQARGQAHLADRRSDIYSLGVILFELLTGELPFRGEWRMLILQKLKDDPPSPRKLNSRIPPDLETICLKCLEREPDRRYQSAQDLSDDLSHWLRDEPIVARPVGRLERVWRWCRRNPTVAALTGSVAVLLIALTSAISIGYLSKAASNRELAASNQKLEEQSAAAIREAEVAGAARAVAETERQRAEREAESARIAKVAAENERQRAENNLLQAAKAVDTFFTQISETQLLNMPESQKLRMKMLEQARRFYQTFLNQNQGNRSLRADLAAAEFRVAQSTIDGDWFTALLTLSGIQRGLGIVEELLSEPDSPDKWRGLRHGVYKGRQRFPAGMEGTRLHPVVAWFMLPTAKRACVVWEKLAQRLPNEPGVKNDLAGLYNVRGIIEDSANLDDRAIRTYEQAINIWEALHQAYPHEANYLRDLAIAYSNKSTVYIARFDKSGAAEDLDAAIQLQQQTLEYQQALVAANRERSFIIDLAGTCRALGDLYERRHDLQSALQSRREALRVLDMLLEPYGAHKDERDQVLKSINDLENHSPADSGDATERADSDSK